MALLFSPQQGHLIYLRNRLAVKKYVTIRLTTEISDVGYNLFVPPHLVRKPAIPNDARPLIYLEGERLSMGSMWRSSFP
jgi:hypothetical protein